MWDDMGSGIIEPTSKLGKKSGSLKLLEHNMAVWIHT